MNRALVLQLSSLVLLIGLSGCVLVAGANEVRSSSSRVEYLTDGTIFPGTVPFSEAVRVGGTLYLSGMIGVSPGTMTLVEGGLEPETRRTMDNIQLTLAAHGYEMRDLVKCTVMLEDISQWGRFNAIYQTYFSGRFPARSALGTNGLALGALVEVECIAAKQ